MEFGRDFVGLQPSRAAAVWTERGLLGQPENSGAGETKQNVIAVTIDIMKQLECYKLKCRYLSGTDAFPVESHNGLKRASTDAEKFFCVLNVLRCEVALNCKHIYFTHKKLDQTT